MANEQREFKLYLHKNKFNALYRKVFFKNKRYRANRISGIKVLNAEEGNNILKKLIMGNNPFAAVRYGGTEMNAFIEGKKYELGLAGRINQQFVDDLQNQSGFFPNDAALISRYTHIMEETSREVDFLATYSTRMEDFMVHKYMKSDVIISDNRSLEPYYFQFNNPWSSALYKKKVLVIHPFARSIEKQYKIHYKLFDDKQILPDFELKTLTAVQTIVGTKDERFNTWFDALEYMFTEAMKIDFDIAILGCGAYGQPLAGKLKKSGEAGDSSRWSDSDYVWNKGEKMELNSKEVPKLFNEFWIRPSADETPQNKEKMNLGVHIGKGKWYESM